MVKLILAVRGANGDLQERIVFQNSKQQETGFAVSVLRSLLRLISKCEQVELTCEKAELTSDGWRALRFANDALATPFSNGVNPSVR
jgi:hypothetical protein